MFSPIKLLFSGKLSSTALTEWRAAPLEASALLARKHVYKYLKYNVYYTTVGFRTAAAANPRNASLGGSGTR